MFEGVLLATAISTAAPTPIARRVQRVCLNTSGASETPLPDDVSLLWDAFGTTMGTGSDRSVARSLTHLLEWKRVATMLPTSDEAEVFVDSLIAANRPRGTVKRVLAPRRR